MREGEAVHPGAPTAHRQPAPAVVPPADGSTRAADVMRSLGLGRLPGGRVGTPDGAPVRGLDAHGWEVRVPELTVLVAAAAALVMLVTATVRVVQEYERGVIFRLGRLVGARGPEAVTEGGMQALPRATQAPAAEPPEDGLPGWILTRGEGRATGTRCGPRRRCRPASPAARASTGDRPAQGSRWQVWRKDGQFGTGWVARAVLARAAAPN